MKGSKLWQLLASSVIAFLKRLLQAEISVIGRAFMGEMLMQEMSELFNKEVNAQKESLKNFRGSHKLPQAHEKVSKETKKK